MYEGVETAMHDMTLLAKILLVAGGVLILAGVIVWLLSRANLLGNLPGDIRTEGSGFSCFIPLASMIILSIVLTILVNVILRMMNK